MTGPSTPRPRPIPWAEVASPALRHLIGIEPIGQQVSLGSVGPTITAHDRRADHQGQGPDSKHPPQLGSPPTSSRQP